MQRVFRTLAIFFVFAPAMAGATTVLDFSLGFVGSSSSLNYNKTAAISGTRARIIAGNQTLSNGAIWSKNKVDVRKFSTQFVFQITAVSDYEAGLSFALQRAANNTSGYWYESLGYSPFTPSIGVKFDCWAQGFSPNSTGLYLNGEFPGDNPPKSIDMGPSGIDLRSGHRFSVSLSYDGTTLHEVVTDLDVIDPQNHTFTHDYTVNIAAIINDDRAYAGFTASTGGGGATHDILTWTYSVTPSAYNINYTAYPEHMQVCPRNVANNTAIIPISGVETVGGFNAAVLRVYRNGIQVGVDQVQSLTYSGGQASFSFNPTIQAELAHYDIELLLRDNSNQLISVRKAQDVVAGDVYIIQGQSNAVAKNVSSAPSDVAGSYANPFVRTFGIESWEPPASQAMTSWIPATGDGVIGNDDIGDAGQWGLVLGNQLMTANSIPVAMIVGAQGGQPISFFQRNDANHTDLSTNYGRVLTRLQKAGVAGGIRAILFYQGESDNDDGATHQAGFTALRSDWLEDYPSVQHIYVFQLRKGSFVNTIDLRNRQRLFGDIFPNLSVFSTNGLDGHDGLHFHFPNGYETMGINAARVLERDLYNGASLPNTDAPNPAYAVLTGANKNIIRIPLRNRTDTMHFDSGAVADFSIDGASVTVSSGQVTNGVIQLNLSGNATGATAINYNSHPGPPPPSGNWVANANGIGLLAFNQPLITDTTPPVITLIGPNPITVGQNSTYTDPGATATDNIDGNISSSIVINTSAVNTAVPGNYTVTFNVSDIAGNAATQVTRTVHVTGAPTANPQSVSTNEDTAKAITLTGSDPDNDPLTFIVVTNPAHGALSGTAPNLTYTPAANYNGSDSFTFKVNDGNGDSNIATVSITVNPVNDAPVANLQSVTTNEDTAKNITLTASDIDGDSLIFSVVAGPAHGVLSGAPPNVTYTPAANYHGPDSFTFKANDSTVDSNVATVSITVDAVNDPPAADPQSVTTNEDIAKAITLTASDVDGDPLSFSVVTNPAHGSLAGTPPNVTYTPTANYHGADSFTFKANDGNIDSNIATVSITVDPVNDPPTADAQSVTTPQDTAKEIVLTGSDVDNDTLTFAVVVNPAHGNLSGTPPDVTYTPATGFNGHDSFTFKVNDGTVDSTPATISITVGSGNEAPTANGQAVATNEDTAKAITLTASDPENDPLTFSVVASPAHGVLTGTPPNLTFTPAANYNGSDSFTFKANDSHADSNIATVSITVDPVNDPPTADAQSVNTNQDTALNVTLTGSDIETLPANLSFTVTVPPVHGSLNGTAPNLTYTPTASYYGPDSFKFTVTDTGDGTSGALTSPEATVSITINGVPVIEIEEPAGFRLVDGVSTVDFGSVAREANNSHTFLINNIGGANLTNLVANLDGTNASEFVVTATPVNPVLPGSSTSVTIKFTPTALGLRNAVMHIASNDQTQNPFDIALTGTGITNLEAFRLQYFGSISNSGDGADTNDFDGDGIPNIMEFATGTNPKQGNAMPGQLTLNVDTLEFLYSQAKVAISDGLTFSVEWTDDLTTPNWNNAGVTEVNLSEDDQFRYMKASVPAGTSGHRFMRLNVMTPMSRPHGARARTR